MWHRYHVDLWPAWGWPPKTDEFGHQVGPPSLFRHTRDGKPKGIIVIEREGTSKLIRSEREYKQTVKRLDKEKAQLAEYQKHLKSEGLSADKIKRLLGPLQVHCCRTC